MKNFEIKNSLSETLNESELYFEHLKYMYRYNLLKRSEIKNYINNTYNSLNNFLKEYVEQNSVSLENSSVKEFKKFLDRIKKFSDSLTLFGPKNLYSEQNNKSL